MSKALKTNNEIRTVEIENLKTRSIVSDDEGEKVIAEGYAAVFNNPSQITSFYEETIAEGAFKNTLNEDVRCLFNHDWSSVLGRTTNNTLKLEEDSHGLKFQVELPDTSLGRDVQRMLERGDVSQCSFGFQILSAEDDLSDPYTIRTTITEVKLYEVSIVSLPAYEETSVSLRSKEVAEIHAKKVKLQNKIKEMY